MKQENRMTLIVTPFTNLFQNYLVGKITAKECKQQFFQLGRKYLNKPIDEARKALRSGKSISVPQYDIWGEEVGKTKISPEMGLTYSDFTWEAMQLIESDFFSAAECFTETPVPGMPFQIDEEEFRKQVKAALDKMAELQEKYQDK